MSPRYLSVNVFLTGASEMLAMEMKACGMYVSRGLSFRQAEVSINCSTTVLKTKLCPKKSQENFTHLLVLIIYLRLKCF